VSTGSYFSGVKLPGCETDHSSPFTAKVKNDGAIPPLIHTSLWRGALFVKHSENFTFFLCIMTLSRLCRVDGGTVTEYGAMGRIRNDTRETYPSATVSTTNPTLPDLGSNPGRRRGKPATNRLSCGTGLCMVSNVTSDVVKTVTLREIQKLVMSPVWGSTPRRNDDRQS
jgi:hypothetical protein